MAAGSEPIAIRTLRSNSVNDTRYLHKDHLGSVDVITNESGSVVERLSYDAFGKRRNATSWSGAPAAGAWTNIANMTHRGFTFHEHLDNVDLVHMNGRVYDPNIGRFISADPFVQAPLMSQSLNRYSYVMNNPLSLVDPSGYSWLSKAFRSIGRFIKKFWRPIVAIAAAVVTFGYLAPMASAWLATSVCLAPGTITIGGGILAGSVSGAIAGGITGGWKGALAGAVMGGVMGGTGAFYSNNWSLGRVAIEGTAGGISAEIQGGSFSDGFMFSAGFSALQWGARSMRQAMVKQSKGNPLNSMGDSDGMYGDNFKLGGGRAMDKDLSLSDVGVSPLGGAQGGPGYVGFKQGGFSYSRGSFWDRLIESYAGPHDWMSSYRYQANGNLAAWSTLGKAAYGIWSAAALVPATPFAFAANVPSYALVPSAEM